MNDTHTPYGARERADLTALDTQLHAANPAIRAEIAPAVADRLRTTLPDIDDTTIGRVLLALTTGPGFIFALLRQEQNPQAQTALTRLWATLAAAGLDLTATARQPEPGT